MNLLLISSGDRERALAWKIAQSPKVKRLFVVPGNASTAQIARNLPIPATDIPALAQAATTHNIDLLVVGPEAPLAAGDFI